MSGRLVLLAPQPRDQAEPCAVGRRQLRDPDPADRALELQERRSRRQPRPRAAQALPRREGTHSQKKKK